MLASKVYFVFCSVFVISIVAFFVLMADRKLINEPSIFRREKARKLNELELNVLNSGFKKHTVEERMTPFKIYSEANRKLVFYNRMPKCGSRTMLTLFQKRNHVFELTETDIFDERQLNEKELYEYVHSFKKSSKKQLRERHLHFVNFERYGLKQPIYINLIREPFEQALSRYYYHFERGLVKKQLKGRKIQTFEECVVNNLNSSLPIKGCVFSSREYVLWFCGHDEACSYMDYGLAKAKRNIEKYYMLIGLTEEYAETLQALELMLPSYFKGMGKIDTNATKKHKIPSSKKIRPSEKIIQLIKIRLGYNYEIYNFVKQKFHITLKSLGIYYTKNSI
ncbi:unnamed protein product [Owenia fusiformis]|uniref:Uncharacterized protein n=1 Tax=Owenia fusiformis TaxID=6347 RepID=A0A8J1YBG2_OWEFU|nr:unnamed protein product [Owenia fusiformis]